MAFVPLVQVLDGRDCGGKAAGLGEALRLGLPVPPGVALRAEHVQALAEAGAGAGGCARTLGLDVEALLGELGGHVVVRSSAAAEDGARASFAGQHETVLGVRDAGALFEAVRRVHASGLEASAGAYRARLGVEGAPRMGVVVQRFVDADRAGVLFTVDPLTGEDVRVVEAAWGLGEAVVAGLVVPDRFVLARDGRVREATPGDKDLAVRPAEAGGTRHEAVPPERATALCLEPHDLGRLGALAAACEAAFGASAPRGLDLEWAFAGAELFLLQARAVTRGAKAPR